MEDGSLGNSSGANNITIRLLLWMDCIVGGLGWFRCVTLALLCGVVTLGSRWARAAARPSDRLLPLLCLFSSSPALFFILAAPIHAFVPWSNTGARVPHFLWPC